MEGDSSFNMDMSVTAARHDGLLARLPAQNRTARNLTLVVTPAKAGGSGDGGIGLGQVPSFDVSRRCHLRWHEGRGAGVGAFAAPAQTRPHHYCTNEKGARFPGRPLHLP